VGREAHPLSICGGTELEQELWTIYEAQKVDLEIIENEKRRLLAPNLIQEMDREIGKSEEKIEKETEVVEELEKERKKKEKELDVDREKIKKFESRLYEVKTNKEYQALLKEIETVKQTNDKLEEEILVIMVKVEELRKDIETSAVWLKKRNKEVEVEKARLFKEIASTDEKIGQLKEQRNNLLSVVSDHLRSTYKMLVEKRNGVAVVNCKNDVCLGCYMNIPPQLYIEVTKNNKLIFCPSCNRILYFVEES
jgi:uncharacterized protein